MTAPSAPELLPTAPAIAGLTARRFAGVSDVSPLVDLMNGANKADDLNWVETPESFANDLTDVEHSDPARDLILVSVDGVLVAAGRTGWRERTDGSVTYRPSGWVDPGWRRRGLGRALLHANERRLRELAQAHADERGAARRVLEGWATEKQPGANALF